MTKTIRAIFTVDIGTTSISQYKELKYTGNKTDKQVESLVLKERKEWEKEIVTSHEILEYE